MFFTKSNDCTKKKLLVFSLIFLFLKSGSLLYSTIRYVSHYTNNPVSPYTSPSTAATNINDALQVAQPGDIIKIIDNYRNYQGFSVMAWSAACNNWWAEPNNLVIKADPQFNPAVSSPGCYSIGIFIGDRNNITISNIDVININTGQPGIKIQGSTNCKILDCMVSNVNGIGIYISDDSGKPTYNTLVKNCRIINGSDVGIKFDNSHFNKVVKCEILRNSNGGIYFGSTSDNNKILDSIIACNGDNSSWDDGIEISEWGNSKHNLIQGCSIYSNSARGILISTGSSTPVSNTIFKCLIYRNGNDGINIYTASGGNRVEYCTLFDNGNNGIALDSDDTLKNSIIVSNDAYGVWGNNSPSISYCCLYGNASGNINSGSLNNCINDDPKFISTAIGSEDFHLKWNSPCQNSAEPHYNQRASIGRYTACMVPQNQIESNSGYHNFIWVSSLSNNFYTSGTVIKIYYSNVNGGSSDFKLNNVTEATSSTLWGPDFSSESGNTSSQYLRAVVNHSVSTLGFAENIAFLDITNGQSSTNSFVVYLSNSYGIETIEGNQFRIFGNTPYHYVSFYTNNPVFPYDTPSTAATDIQTVINCSALTPGDEIIIIDNYKQYSGIYMNSSAPSSIKIYAASGFSPAISNSQFTYNNGIYIDGPDNIVISNLIIKNNTGDGISINNSDNSIIISNKIYYNNRSGIAVKGCNNLKIIGNEIWSNGNNTSFTSEYAGVYFWTNTMPGSVIRDNIIHHNPVNIKILRNPVSFTLYNNICNNAQNSNYYGFNILIAGGKKNCIISNTLSDTWFDGRNMKLTWSDSNIIKYNTFKNSDSGIRFESSRENIVSHNFISNVGLGVFMYKGVEPFAPFSSSNKIFTNILINTNSGYGIYIERGYNTIIQSNIISGWEIGIYEGTTFLHGADRTIAKLNIIKNCQKSGILIRYGNNSIIESNTIISNGKDDSTAGIRFYFHNNNCIIRSNNISFNSNNGIVVKGTNNQIIKNRIHNNINRGIRLDSFSFSNIISSNIVYNQNYGIILEEGCYCNTLITNVLYSNFNTGLFLTSGTYAADTNKIINNQIYNNNVGVHLNGVANNVLTNCCIYNNNNIGIKLDHADINKIKSCNITDNNWEGIYFGGSCTNNLVENCLVKNNNSEGIELSAWGEHFKNSIQHCNIISNQQYGIHIEGNSCSNFISFSEISSNNWEGIFIYRSDCNTIYSNTIKNNKIEGILIKSNSINNIIKKNTISYNTNGIRLENRSSGNMIISNEIFKNDCEGICVIHSSYSNKIYDNTIYSNIYQGIRIVSNANQNKVVNNNLWENGDGVKIEADSHTNSIFSNYISNNNWKGLYIINSCYNTIYSNIIHNNTWEGVLIENNSIQNIITNNIINGNNEGVKVDTSDSNKILFNCFKSNNYQAVRIVDSDKIFIKNNEMETNGEGIKLDGNCRLCSVISNIISRSKWKGIYIINSTNNKITGNKVYRNGDSGIRISGGKYNRIIGNLSLTNSSGSGLMIDSGANSHYSASNIFAYNNYGIEINNASCCTLFRNAIYHNNKDGIRLQNSANNNSIINNSLSSNGITGGDGIYLSSGLSGNIIKNTIIAFTYSGFGINDNTAGGSASITYCDVYGNSSGNYGGSATSSTGCISSDPLWLSYNLYSSNFLYLQETSPCVDKGDPSDPVPPDGGPYIDMGWKELTRPYLLLDIAKNIYSIELGSTNSFPIPGAIIKYKISYEVRGNKPATNILIYDRVPPFTTYRTAYQSTATGWIIEFSTNINPDQSYSSADYTAVMPPKEKIKWFRWKKSVESNTYGYKTFSFWCIIK